MIKIDKLIDEFQIPKSSEENNFAVQMNTILGGKDIFNIDTTGRNITFSVNYEN